MRTFLIFIVLILLAAGAGYYEYTVLVPDVAILKTHYPVVVYHADTKESEIILEKAKPKSWVSVREVSKKALGAIIVSEDWAFFQHDGYDINQIEIVVQESIEKGKLGRGASTITQQVVKNVFLSNERSLVRKALELYLATKIEAVLTKNKILELYINIAEMGPGIFGIGAAAKYYFSKTPAELNPKEGAFLAMLLPSPVRYGQSFRQKKLTAFAHSSVEKILDKMVQAQYITEEERAAMNLIPLAFEQTPEATAAAPETPGAAAENPENSGADHEQPQAAAQPQQPGSAVQEEIAKQAASAAEVPHGDSNPPPAAADPAIKPETTEPSQNQPQSAPSAEQ